jgi:hypothetical protein
MHLDYNIPCPFWKILCKPNLAAGQQLPKSVPHKNKKLKNVSICVPFSTFLEAIISIYHSGSNAKKI